jgi:threonine dehydrogenase-like Zn-dependent dehydrogenase
VALGADTVVDPAEGTPWQSWREAAVWSDPSRAPQLPPWVPGPPRRPAVVFECVGVPGVLDQIMAAAPARHPHRGGRRVHGAGHDLPLARHRQGAERAVRLGYTPDEFAATLGHIAEGAIPVAPLLTGRVGLGGVARAFEDLAAPNRHAKILVEPARD